MSPNYNGGRGGSKKQDGKITDKFRGACPPHKVKDLDALVKEYKGDEEKIQAKISEWWEEPQIAEPEWEAVDRKGAKKVADKKSGGFKSDRGSAGGSGSSGRKNDRISAFRDGGRGMSRGDARGGRGGNRYGDRDKDRSGGKFGGGIIQRGGTVQVAASAPAVPPKSDRGVPAPVTNVPAPKGAWGQSFAAAAAAAAAPNVPVPAPAPEPTPEMPPALDTEEPTVDLGGPVSVISPEDPTPSGLPPQPKLTPTPLAQSVSGNVWATRGSAHLIQAEKAKPIPPPAAPLPVIQQAEPEPEHELEPEHEVEEPELQYEEVRITEEPLPVEVVEDSLPEPEPEPELEPESEPDQLVVEDSLNTVGVTLDSVLSPSVNGANINASGWEPLEPTPQPSVEIPQRSPVGGMSVGTATSIPEPISVDEPVSMPEPISASAPAAPVGAPVGIKPSSVLNMGHWETGDADDELDFGFGSFGPENDNEAADANVSAPTSTTENAPLPAAPAAATHPSPARPPPGLSMPPMPANAMLVHELENKLEGTSLGPKPEDSSAKTLPEKKDLGVPNQASIQPQVFTSGNDFGIQPGMPQYGGYGMGIYNYGATSMAPGASNAFGSMPAGQFPLGGAVNQQQPKSQPTGISSQPQGVTRASPQPLTQQPQGPYTMQNPPGSTTSDGTSSNDGPNASSMPPGMPGMQYPNPAFMYGQYNQMGHPAYAGLQYGYGQGQQYGVQGGFGYHQVMGHQGGGYGGGPGPYEDQGPHSHNSSHMRDSHQGGGYRGRNHHQNKYGNNYQSQGGYGGYQSQGGYGGGPYAGGGYGPSGMDHYGMQQQGGGYGSGGGFSHNDNNDHNKGKNKGPHRNGNQQFQQQPFGMQGSSTDSGAGGSGGWPASGQSWGGSGGWQQDN
mmetsp:Transcript_12501/g.24376  ORF Transcript_12501/g.24376 Transcript_12501/m.24376 type:complete len:895 (+) Transcript_12501:167-2851(+)